MINESIFKQEIYRFLGFWYVKEDWSTLSKRNQANQQGKFLKAFREHSLLETDIIITFCKKHSLFFFVQILKMCSVHWKKPQTILLQVTCWLILTSPQKL